MPKLPRISGDDLVKALGRIGFVAIRQRGSHVVMKRMTAGGVSGCVVPMHRELALGTLHSALRQAGVSVEELLANL